MRKLPLLFVLKNVRVYVTLNIHVIAQTIKKIISFSLSKCNLLISFCSKYFKFLCCTSNCRNI